MNALNCVWSDTLNPARIREVDKDFAKNVILKT